MKNGLPRFDPFWTALGKVFLWLLFHIYLPAKVIGRKNMPRKGAVIVIANHVSYIDPIFIGWALQPRLIHYMGKKELFHNKFVRFIITRWGMFPVDRDSFDRHAMTVALTMLKEGAVLGLFPEGTRSSSGELQQMRSGAVRFAIKMRCPLLPVAISGTEKSYPRGAKFPKPARLKLNVGQPFELSQFYDTPMTSEASEQAIAIMREKIAALQG